MATIRPREERKSTQSTNAVETEEESYETNFIPIQKLEVCYFVICTTMHVSNLFILFRRVLASMQPISRSCNKLVTIRWSRCSMWLKSLWRRSKVSAISKPKRLW